MGKSKWGRLVGTILMAIGALGVSFAVGNLASLPSIQRQLLEVVPTAAAATAEAVSQSRTKSYYGLAIFGTLLVSGWALIGVSRRPHSSLAASTDDL